MKILIIQDNVPLAELTRTVLVNNDYEAAICNDAFEGIDCVSAYRPNLILIEMHMPDFSGVEILQFIKMDQRMNDVPIVFISGLMIGDERVLQNVSLEVDGIQYPIFSKPYASERLLNMVKKYARIGRNGEK